MTRKYLHLQGMRGFAICSVVLFHYFPARFPNGYLGVDLFFVLSGYLMAMMLARHKSLSTSIILEFLYRRLKRIAPLYYLTILITTGCLFFLPFSNIYPNLTNAWNAIFLQTNLIKNGDTDYFQKLGVARDLFTHTWSLCLEMQFYAIFPLIWILQSKFIDFRRIYIIYIICAMSFAYYSLSSEFISFNSVFSRIWQFLLGNVVFLLENNDQVDDPSGYKLLLPKNGEKTEEGELDTYKKNCKNTAVSAEWITSSFALSLLIFTTVSKDHLYQHYARFTTTIISSILILFGRQFGLLESRLIVFIGEISYSWYLVHWPMVSAQKLLEFDGPLEMGYGMISSFLLAIVVHYAVEKRYLNWQKSVVIVSVVTLMFANLGLIYVLDDYVHRPFDSQLMFKVSQMTKTELKKYNLQMSENDMMQLRMQNCTYIPEKKKWDGYCEYQKPNPKRNNTILVIGNSWAANVAPIVFDECREYAGKLAVKTTSSCEVLYNTTRVPCEDHYLQDVIRVRPDQLFIIVRAVDQANPRGAKEMPAVVNYAVQRLKVFDKYVRDKIFILNVFTSFSDKIEKFMRKTIDTGIPPKYTDIRDNDKGIDAARAAMQEAVKGCSKCVLYDYVPYFNFTGTILPYHPKTFASFMTKGKHFTPLGLERVRPLYKKLCSNL